MFVGKSFPEKACGFSFTNLNLEKRKDGNEKSLLVNTVKYLELNFMQ